MGNQIKISELKNISQTEIDEIKRIVDLEKKYQTILWELFTSQDFIKDLEHIEMYLKDNFGSIKATWELKNILKIGAERIARHHIYSDLHLFGCNVRGIYPSPISGDIGLILDDIILSLDVKTLDTHGNSTDIGNIQFLPNQSSFKNKNLDSDSLIPDSGVKVETLLPVDYLHNNLHKPVLTYFLTIIYTDDNENFCLNRDSRFGTIHLSSLPNGRTSILYDNDLVDNFKTYKYFKDTPFKPKLLIRNSNLNEANAHVIQIQMRQPNYKIINGRSKIGLYDPNAIHPRYLSRGVSWFPVSRKIPNSNPVSYEFFLSAVQMGDTSRIMRGKLRVRYDSTDNEWNGMLVLTL